MTTDPVRLAALIVKRITADVTATYTTLENRAIEKGIDLSIFEQAMVRVHRTKNIERTTKNGDIVYTYKPPIIKQPGSHLTWVNNNYPQMDSSNDGSGIDIDFSFLFLTPEQLDQYKAEVAGRSYIPKKRYAVKNT